MKVSGSVVPMTFEHNNNQYLIINASGGTFVGIDKLIEENIYAFKLKN